VDVARWAAQTALRVKGDFVECGVNAGFFSSAIMNKLRWNTLGRRFYLIDTFTGPVLAQYSPEEVLKFRRVADRDSGAGRSPGDSGKSRFRSGRILAHRHELCVAGAAGVGIFLGPDATRRCHPV
jgi:hypothetical protein